MSLNELTLLELSEKLSAKTVSSVEATQVLLKRIAQVQPQTNAFIAVDEEGALEEAKASDERRGRGGSRGPLDGIPIALKDNIFVEGQKTTCASLILKDFVAPMDAAVTTQLRQAGMPIVGKLNMDDLAMGSSSASSVFGATHNPYALGRSPGGSSGGAAAAVAARASWAALGSDTGGSIRQPASFCNVVGLKPSFGRVSRRGVVGYASSLDQVGPMARTVKDAALLLNMLAQPDEGDVLCRTAAGGDYMQGIEGGIRGMRIGLWKEGLAWAEEGVAEQIREAAKACEKLGATVVEVSFPLSHLGPLAYAIISAAEASSNLARLDGVRYGYAHRGSKNLRELYFKSRGEGLGKAVKNKLVLGTFTLSHGYYEDFFVKAAKLRTLLSEEIGKALKEVEVVLSPVASTPAFPLDFSPTPAQSAELDKHTVLANLAGLPALSLPYGFSATGLPIGLHLMGRAFEEATLLRLAYALEQDKPCFQKAPTLPAV
ncbi:MAG: Asp-tRNA(Asn)/Glu-tRNA(Gln) amidotransferase subunit GatA [Proteobacteria bacterium]|nr:Asp-tRNA(Asn)/Glu-tRNA(Gln) amidotransferase subunit GatA [Cystobacterineae bacterium]MCL2259454.1 Asp-tRNA(Asn)/Glu-tRNA(Gln) amidotransferase subunit GatA [Cystobacterineae bacterium]MCL2314102.1 Asp-tRNA(Asn)/Glu-tRNA(Gln) amidotransferase subunit GatA [Pseudomonadota bacterium]